jgi:hypothetical protein
MVDPVVTEVGRARSAGMGAREQMARTEVPAAMVVTAAPGLSLVETVDTAGTGPATPTADMEAKAPSEEYSGVLAATGAMDLGTETLETAAAAATA